MEAHQLVRTVVNKTMVPKQKGRGRRGYGNLSRVRVLVYAAVKGIHNDSKLTRHLKKRSEVRRELGLSSTPERTSLSRWRKGYGKLVKEAFRKLSELVRKITGSELLIVDSTPLEDQKDPDAAVGYYSKGPFKGFKAHLSVNQLGLPMKAVVSRGNRHDMNYFRQLLVDASKVLGDAGYDSRENRQTARSRNIDPIIARNPRNTGKQHEAPKLLKRKRYLVEQFNSLFKTVLNKAWKRFKGIKRARSLVYSSLTAILLVSIPNLGEVEARGLRTVARYWH